MLLRNKEVKNTAIILLILSIIFTGLGFYVNLKAGLLIIAICVLFCALFYILTRKRYRRIRELSAEIDHLLHGAERFDYDAFNEGELAVLSTEVRKMLFRMREQSDRLAREKLFLTDSMENITHQLRTPLTSVTLLASFLSEPELTPENRLRFTNDMKNLLTRMEWLITTLLKMSKLEAGTAVFKKESFKVNELLQISAEPFVIPLELKNIKLNILGDESAELCGDIKWLSEAIGNIIKNCIEHTGADGKLDIEYSENAIYTEIIISDNGGGFNEKDLPRIFERFYQGENACESSFGVGLALARAIFAEQNATIKASNGEEGAVFTIKFYHQTV